MNPTLSHFATSSAWLAITKSRRVRYGFAGVDRLWIVPRNDVIGEAPDRIHIAARREELEGADTDVARRDAGQYGAGQRRLAPNRLTGRHSGERSGRRDSKRGHGLADDVF